MQLRGLFHPISIAFSHHQKLSVDFSRDYSSLHSLYKYIEYIFKDYFIASNEVGKEGISNNLINGLNDALEAHELIKLSVLKNCTSNIKEVAFDIASSTNSEIIQIIGRNIVLYRKSKKQLIEL